MDESVADTLWAVIRTNTEYSWQRTLVAHGLSETAANEKVQEIVSGWRKPHGQEFSTLPYQSGTLYQTLRDHGILY